MKTAVIYARYSSDSQSEQSIEGQLRVCQEYAKSNNMLIVDTYIDRAMTGTNDNRVSFQKLLKDSAKQQWNFVIVYKLDRFSRNKYESVVHKKTLKDNGIKLLSAMENIPDSPEGNLMEALLEGFNQYFSEELAQKVNRGIKESWLKGNSTGGQELFGYDVLDKKYVINQFEADIIREVFTRYSQGYKAKAVAKELQERGTRRKNGKLIDHKYLYFILHNIRYTGIVEHQGNIYDNIFPRIISDEVWMAVNAINEDNKIAPSRKKEIFDYILSGKLICGYCKHRMSGESGTSHTGNSHYYYVCNSRRKKRANCITKAITKQYLEDVVINTTAKMLNTPGAIDKIARTLFEVHKQEATDNTALKLMTKQRDAAVKSSNNLIKAIEQGIITEQTKNRLRELETEISRLEFDIDREKQRTYTYLTVEDMAMFIQAKVFDTTDDIKIRKLLVNTFIREVILYEDQIIITYNFTEVHDTIKLTPEHIETIEKQSKSTKTTAFPSNPSSCIFSAGAPNAKTTEIGGFFLNFDNIRLPRKY